MSKSIQEVWYFSCANSKLLLFLQNDGKNYQCSLTEVSVIFTMESRKMRKLISLGKWQSQSVVNERSISLVSSVSNSVVSKFCKLWCNCRMSGISNCIVLLCSVSSLSSVNSCFSVVNTYHCCINKK